MLRVVVLFVVLSALTVGSVRGQGSLDPEVRARLEQIFPAAESFSAKEGSPPHFKAYGPEGSDGRRELLGLAYWTTELEPLERGYDGPIQMLVGMDPRGILHGVIVTDHREPYGYFSVDLPEFVEQFERKDIRDRFRVGDDIDAISRATVTVRSASRAVRNSSRRIARAHLTPPEK